MGRLCGVVVVFLVVDLLLFLFSSLFDLLLLLLGERAAIVGAFVVDLLVEIRLMRLVRAASPEVIWPLRRPGGALLLVGFPVVHFVGRDRVPLCFSL